MKFYQFRVFRLLFLTTILDVLAQTPKRVNRQVIFPDDDDEPRRAGTSEPTVQRNCDHSPSRFAQCIKITDCPRLVRLRNDSRLQQFLCGYDQLEPKVCCPVQREPQSGPTFTPRPGRPPTQRRRLSTTPIPRPRPTHNPRPRPVTYTPTKQEDNIPKIFPQECGRSSVPGRRIVGGFESERGAWPWIVCLFIEESGVKNAKCGGTLVTSDCVITAAHCVTGEDERVFPASAFTARLAEHDLNDNEDGAIDIPIASVKLHENYDFRTFKNDLAILKLTRKVHFNARIQPICLPYASLATEDLTGKNATIAGWGATALNGPHNSVLLEANITVWEKEKCAVAYRGYVPITKEYLCAGTAGSEKDSCQGDSGGGLMMVGREKRFYLMGVVSFGKGCATPGYPGVYTNVRIFLPWITRNAA